MGEVIKLFGDTARNPDDDLSMTEDQQVEFETAVRGLSKASNGHVPRDPKKVAAITRLHAARTGSLAERGIIADPSRSSTAFVRGYERVAFEASDSEVKQTYEIRNVTEFHGSEAVVECHTFAVDTGQAVYIENLWSEDAGTGARHRILTEGVSLAGEEAFAEDLNESSTKINVDFTITDQGPTFTRGHFKEAMGLVERINTEPGWAIERVPTR